MKSETELKFIIELKLKLTQKLKMKLFMTNFGIQIKFRNEIRIEFDSESKMEPILNSKQTLNQFFEIETKRKEKKIII